jgi:EAL domain-containing protein (putative c-di-GMP-specific phosphodiesterase class I)
MERIGAANIPGHKLCFELTETAAISNLSQATDVIHKLKQHGCHFALDDFGSGMSSFAYLKALGADFLKIDGLFVGNISQDKVDYAMVRSITEIGHVMGKKVIAESVETDEVIAKLGEIGVDYAQGFRVGEPRPIDEIASVGIADLLAS